MRIAIINWSRRKVGGAESYLETVIRALREAGHEVAFFHETDEPSSHEQLALPDEVTVWCVAASGAQRALEALRGWQPDLLYTHRFLDQALERETLDIAPAIFFAHDYNGACISGGKTFKSPAPVPCTRRFDWKCLLHYYPHRCGGLSPVTMLRDYTRQSKRLEMLHRYRVIVTNSNHLRDEFARYGLTAHQVYLPVEGSAALPAPHETHAEWRLLFLGRMDFLKGGRILIDALPRVCAALGKALRVTFAGDGPDRAVWERDAARAQAGTQGLRIDFVGWVNEEQRDRLLSECDLLVVPSLWPEPFGLVGPEAGLRGVPAAAFAVGGIPEWLTDGVNGFLAPGAPPTAAGLAEAVNKCLDNRLTYERLRRGALKEAQRFSGERHLDSLLEIFRRVLAPINNHS